MSTITNGSHHNGQSTNSGSESIKNDLNNNQVSHKKRICIIGAGAAGLCVARHLSTNLELFEIVILEQSSKIGGTWNYTPEIGRDKNGLLIHSSMYKNLRTNIPLNVMEFPDFKSSKVSKSTAEGFVTHQEVLTYLSDYADHYQLMKFVHFEHVVLKVSKINEIEWRVKFEDLKNNFIKNQIFHSVIVCNGRYSSPSIPEIDNLSSSFQGQILHSHDYREPDKIVISNVKNNIIIIGAGPSGIDISLEIANYDPKFTTVYLLHLLSDSFVDLPENIIQIKSTIQEIKDEDKVKNGGKIKNGDEKIDYEETETTIKNSSSTVILKNGQVLKNITCIIFATGYNYDFNKFLDPNLGLKVINNQIQNLYLHLISVVEPTLFLFAIPQKILPFPIYHQQSNLVLKVLSDQVKLPSRKEMLLEIDSEVENRKILGIPIRHSHKMVTSRLLWDYDDKLSHLGHITPIKPVIRSIFESLHQHRKNNSRNYKNLKFRILNDFKFQVIDPKHEGAL